MKKFWDDFKAFAIKGNMIDLAIGIVIGASFNKIIDALVKGLISPPLSYLTGGIEMADKAWTLITPTFDAAGVEIPGSGLVIKYGLVLETGLDFLIIAFTIFVVLRLVKNLRDRAEDEKDTTVPTPKDIQLLAEIRDGINSLAKRDA
ncbi:MAG: large conductance mechanosensitive channel protein MscL [Saprospiraceae bacterium]